MKRVMLAAGVLLLVIVFGASAGGSSEKQGAASTSTQSGAAAASGGIFKIAEYIVPAQMSNLNPFQQTGNYRNLFEFVYDTLLYFNPVQKKLDPRLATSFSWSQNNRTLTFVLHSGVKWQDGTPFSAEDVVYTFSILKDNPVLDTYQLWDSLESVTAQGDQVIFKTKSAFPSLPYYISTVYIVPKHIWEKENPVTFLNTNPIGTGAFIFKKYNTGTDIQLEANKNYFGGAPHIDGIDILTYSSASATTLALLKGDASQTLGTIAMPSIPKLLENKNSHMQAYPGLLNFVVLLNNENKLLSNPIVRRAMIMAVDRKTLIEKGELNAVYPMNDAFLPDLFGALVDKNSFNAESLAYNPQAAEKLLSDNGFTKGSDGYFMDKNGTRLSFTYYEAAGAPAQENEANMMQQWLKAVGIEAKPKLATWPELTSIARSGNYDMVQLGINLPPDPFTFLNAVFNSSATAPIGQNTNGLNYGRYRNPKVDALLAKLDTTYDANAREALFHQIQQEIVSSVPPYIPMYNVGGHIIYNTSQFTGFTKDYPVASVQNMISIHKR